jgi:CDP-diacylglycerol---serine O-phosphatidyltransferase
MHDGEDISVPDAPDVLVRKRRKGIYILPNLFTLAALFGGFYAIVMAMNGRFDQAAVGVFCAMILDSLDGRVARMTNTQSAFGEQMDSLSDMVSFGAAPALIAYVWALNTLGRWGWIAAFVYCACAALRLARFNVNTTVVDKRFFQGLPSPAAAALVAGFIWLLTEAGINGPGRLDVGLFYLQVPWVMFALTLYSGLTMVTNVPFYSFKDIQMKKSVPFAVIVLIALGIGVVNIHPPIVMFGIFVAYGFSGYAVYAWRRSKGIQTSVVSTSTDEPDERGLHR